MEIHKQFSYVFIWAAVSLVVVRQFKLQNLTYKERGHQHCFGQWWLREHKQRININNISSQDKINIFGLLIECSVSEVAMIIRKREMAGKKY